MKCCPIVVIIIFYEVTPYTFMCSPTGKMKATEAYTRYSAARLLARVGKNGLKHQARWDYYSITVINPSLALGHRFLDRDKQGRVIKVSKANVFKKICKSIENA